MRLAGTAVVCIAAAFGAAFLVGRAVGHSNSTKRPLVVSTASTVKTTNAAAAVHTRLLAEFKPIHAPRVVKKPKVRHHAKSKASPTPSASAVTATQSTPSSSSTTPASTYTAPTYSAPAAASSTPSHSSGSGGGGSGTTTIGGSGKSSGSSTSKLGG
jgi:hypothetical protein